MKSFLTYLQVLYSKIPSEIANHTKPDKKYYDFPIINIYKHNKVWFIKLDIIRDEQQ